MNETTTEQQCPVVVHTSLCSSLSCKIQNVQANNKP